MKRFQLIFTKILPYVACFLLVLGLMFFGSKSENSAIKEPIAASFENADFKVTADQVSESFTVANIANAVSLPSTATINENYVTIDSIYTDTGVVSNSGSTVIEKPSIIDTSNLTRGVISYVVQEGDTVTSLAAKYGLTNDQIRWSNGLKNESISVGSTLYLPSVSGIVYTVKSGDTVASLAEKYHSNADNIISFNDLETETTLTEGSKIIIPGGALPETERPEYVAPRQNTSYSYRSYYVTDSADRHGMFEVGSYSYWRNVFYATKGWNNPGSFGNCTWFAWYWRRANMPENYWLPHGAIGNANSWIRTLGGQYRTGRTPAYGAVMQSSGGAFGHVSVVVGVNAGVNITIQEMNYAGPNGKFNHVYQSTIDWSDALKYNYIYERR